MVNFETCEIRCDCVTLSEDYKNVTIHKYRRLSL